MTRPINDTLPVLQRATTKLASSGGLLNGKYVSTRNDKPCYCIVGALRAALLEMTPPEAPFHSTLQTMAAELVVTLRTYDPAGYDIVKDKIAGQERRVGKIANQEEWVFVYNDEVLFPQAQGDGSVASASARDKAVELLTATVERLKAAS